MKLRNLIPAAILSALSLSAFAGRGNAVGLVKNVSVHLNNWQSTNVNQTGLLFIEMAELPGNLCSHSRAALPTNHPLYDSVLKMALEAQEQGKPLRITYGDGCNYRSNALDILIVSIAE